MGISGSCVRGHDEDNVPEIHLPSLVVRDDGIVHDLKKEIVDVFMSLLYFIKKQYAVWILPDSVSQDSAVVIADIAGRGADQFCYRMLLRIFTHVKTVERNMELLRQNF